MYLDLQTPRCISVTVLCNPKCYSWVHQLSGIRFLLPSTSSSLLKLLLQGHSNNQKEDPVYHRKPVWCNFVICNSSVSNTCLLNGYDLLCSLFLPVSRIRICAHSWGSWIYIRYTVLWIRTDRIRNLLARSDPKILNGSGSGSDLLTRKFL